MPHPALFTRRRFLQASGVCLGLPWLEAFAQERNTAPPKRAVFVFVPNGVNMWHFHPATTGRDYQLTPTLRPLADVRHRLTILSGVQHIRVKGGHEEWAHMLTCNVNSDVASKHTLVRANTISIDQHIAEAIGARTRWPSMVVGADGGRMTCSFNRQGLPVLADFDLRSIFDELVGADPHGRQQHRASILDLVSEQANSLRSELGRSDERRLDEYLESVRGIERRVRADQTFRNTPRPAIDESRLSLSADPFDGRQQTNYVDTMFELIFLALEMDCTRVATFTSTRSEGGGPLKALGGDWHGQGHNTRDMIESTEPRAFGVLTAFDIWWHERFARFLDRLSRATENGRDLLRNTAVFFGRGMSWPAFHRVDNLPLILAGGEGMGFVQGRHLAFNGQTPIVPVNRQAPPARRDLGPNPASVSDLLRTISERMDVPARGFGESRRTLDELLA